MQIAVNPLQWLATDDGWLDFGKALPFEELMAKVVEAGYDAVHCEPPAGMSADDYAAGLAKFGLRVAPGYYSAALEDASRQAEVVREAGRRAEYHRALGLTEMFVAAGMAYHSPRVLRPAQGFDASEARLSRIADTLRLVGEETRAHGVTACLHPHVGTWIEVESEVEWLLAHLDPDVIALGPDTGHLAWTGADVLSFVTRHRDRIRALHIKDIRLAVAADHRGGDGDYRAVVRAGLWVEPGRGDLDFESIFAVLDGSPCTWGIVEVDKPDLPTPEESAKAAAVWARDTVSTRNATLLR